MCLGSPVFSEKYETDDAGSQPIHRCVLALRNPEFELSHAVTSSGFSNGEVTHIVSRELGHRISAQPRVFIAR